MRDPHDRAPPTRSTVELFVIQGSALRAMPLTVRLDADTEHCLDDLLAELVV